MRLFSEAERKDKSPARFSESDFEFLDRVAGAHWDRVRALLEQWFTDHPAQRNATSTTDSWIPTTASTWVLGGSCTSPACSGIWDTTFSRTPPSRGRNASLISS